VKHKSVTARHGRRLSSADFGGSDAPRQGQGLNAAKLVLRCNQHTLLFAKMQMDFALRRGKDYP